MKTTGIDTLDTLIGLDADKGMDIPQGSIILLRGGPGSGKTTLALQMLAKHLEVPGNIGVFVSLEVDPTRAITHVKTNFRLGVAPADSKTTNSTLDGVHSIDGDGVLKAIADAAQANPERYLEQAFRNIADLIRKGNTAPIPTLFVVVDGLNALASMLSLDQNPTSQNLRCQLQELVKATRFGLNDSVVLFTAEYHPTTAPESFGSLVSESFVCDIEILLRPEAVAGEAKFPPSAVNQLGYGVERQKRGESWLDQAVEIRSFCRVLKSRWTSSQSRRCQYDIIKNSGIVFDETYPGDGELLLFCENEQQRAIWKDFFENDTPVMFPALRYDTFDVKRLQRVFATQRAYGERRIDLYLGSFDGYWIDYFSQLSQRIFIRRSLESAVPSGTGVAALGKPEFWNLVCDIHQLAHEAVSKQVTQEAVIIGSPALSERVQTSASALQIAAAKLHEIIADIIGHLSSPEGRAGICEPIRNVRLFGELMSPLIVSLKNALIPADPGNTVYRSIPYNANISFLVYRRDIFDHFVKVSTVPLAPEAIAKEMRAAYEIQLAALQQAYPDAWQGVTGSPDWQDHANKLALQLSTGAMPETWEELIALCTLTGKRFLIETHTFDTIMCTLLEMVWSFGGRLQIGRDFSVEGSRAETELRVFQALFLLRYMFSRGIVLPNSTMDLKGLENPRHHEERTADCLFGRHWYSTIVDLLTARRSTKQSVQMHGNGEVGPAWLWQPPEQAKVQLEICKIPVSLSEYAKTGGKAIHHSCWGDWHLAALAGSENARLAERLVNHFLSSHKVWEMATAGAAVPTVEYFYFRGSPVGNTNSTSPRYAGKRCLDIIERSDIGQPSLTYEELYNDFFPHALSRSDIFDYRHCMHELHGVLEYVRSQPTGGVIQLPDEAIVLKDRVTKAFDAILKLRDKEMMVH